MVGVTVTVPDVPEAVKPVPTHEVTLVEDQVSVVDWPFATEVGDAVSVAVGAGEPLEVVVVVVVVVTAAVTATLAFALAVPPAPVQLME